MLDDLKPGDLILVRDDPRAAWKVAWFHKVDTDNAGEPGIIATLWDVEHAQCGCYKEARRLPAFFRQPSSNGSYMLSVDGARAPSRIHESLEAAEREAERLIRERNAPVVRILRLEKTLRRRIVIEEE